MKFDQIKKDVGCFPADLVALPVLVGLVCLFLVCLPVGSRQSNGPETRNEKSSLTSWVHTYEARYRAGQWKEPALDAS